MALVHTGNVAMARRFCDATGVGYAETLCNAAISRAPPARATSTARPTSSSVLMPVDITSCRPVDAADWSSPSMSGHRWQSCRRRCGSTRASRRRSCENGVAITAIPRSRARLATARCALAFSSNALKNSQSDVARTCAGAGHEAETSCFAVSDCSFTALAPAQKAASTIARARSREPE
jgi:hypothetical protein